MKKYILIILIIGILFITVFAEKDVITFTLDQNEYYFHVNEDMIILLHSENNYDKNIQGVFSTKIKSEVYQQNSVINTEHSNSNSFIIQKGESNISLGFGKQDIPGKLTASINFAYTDDELEKYNVNLDNIIINIIPQDEDKQENNQQQQSSSLNENEQAEQSMSEKIQDKMDEMFQNQEPESSMSKKMQQQLQNNQMNQDSNALKQQMQEQMNEQEQMNDEFIKNLEENKDFQELQNDMQSQDFKEMEKNINAEDSKNGQFEIKYNNSNGQESTIKGELNNGTLKNLERQDSFNQNKLLENMENDSEYQDIKKQLEKDGFQEQSTKFNQEKNDTQITKEFINEKNKTANIIAEFNKEELKDIKLEKDNNYLLISLLVILLISFVVVFVYKKKIKKNISELKKEIIKEKFDYKKYVQNLLKNSQELFANKKHKDAYSKANQALRIFYAYEYCLNKEITNDELIMFLKTKQLKYKSIKECCDLCSLVEFAKYKPNEKDFNEIIKKIKEVID